jgi:hypothetical protein
MYTVTSDLETLNNETYGQSFVRETRIHVPHILKVHHLEGVGGGPVGIYFCGQF